MTGVELEELIQDSGRTVFIPENVTAPGGINLTGVRNKHIYGAGHTISFPGATSQAGIRLDNCAHVWWGGTHLDGRDSAIDHGVLIIGGYQTRVHFPTLYNFNNIGIGVHTSRETDILYGVIDRNGFDGPPGAKGKIGVIAPTRPAIWAYHARHLTVLGTVVRGRANGPHGDGAIAFNYSHNIRVLGVKSYSAGSSSIYFNDSHFATVRGCLFQGSSEFGIDVVAESSDIVFAHNRIYDPAYGWSAIAPAWGKGPPQRIFLIKNTWRGESHVGNTLPHHNISDDSDVIMCGNIEL